MRNKLHFLVLFAPLSFKAVANDDIYSLNLEQLSEISVSSSTSLTTTTKRLQPAKTTSIDFQLLNSVGAANQIDLLNMLVPELQVVSNKGLGHNPAFRGLAPSAPNAHQYLINGRSMNMNFFLGSWVEAYNLMGDINSVEVIHGPGSVIHGPGALSGVVSVQTHDVMSFQGLELTAKHMLENKSDIAEIKFGHKTDENAGFFIYAGFEDQEGADRHHSPVRYSNSFTAINGYEIVAGQDANINLSNYQESPDNDYKVFVDYTNNNFNAWFRYSHESERLYIDRTKLSLIQPDNVVLLDGIGAEFLINNSNSYIYRNYSFEINNTWQFNNGLSLLALIGGDKIDSDFDFPRPNGGVRVINHYEDEINAKLLLNWPLNDNHILAVGLEASDHNYEFNVNGLAASTEPWSVFSYAGLFEHQWHISNKWTSFLGGRLDKGRYSENLFSPRLAVVYAANNADTWKFIANRAVRFPPELVARLDALKGSNTTKEEVLDSLEISFDSVLNQNLSYNLSAYYQELDAIDSLGGLQANVGKFDTYGFTLSTTYEQDNLTFLFSHSIVELIDAEDKPGIDPSNFSAAGQGYGNDLNAWANHNTKMNVIYSLSETFAINSSLNILWDYPGSQDLGEYNSFVRDTRANPASIVIDSGYTEAFEHNIEWSIGAAYQWNKATALRFDAYNIVSLFDDEHNRYQDRNYGTYRVKPFSVLLSLTYKI